jgi:hypothetical protein
METLMTQSALVVDHLVLRTATEDAEIDLLRQALNEGHYLKAGRPAGHVLWQGIYRIDPVELARALNAWLTENSELLPKSLALDGKSIGAKGRLGGIVTLCFHATGQPLAQRTCSGKKDDCELPVAQRLLDKDAADQLQGALVTGDALNTQKKRHLLSSATAVTTC